MDVHRVAAVLEDELAAVGRAVLLGAGERVVVGRAADVGAGLAGSETQKQKQNSERPQPEKTRQPATSATAAIEVGRNTFQPSRISWS